MRILGIDPGSRLTGYGCVDWINHQLRPVTHGTIKLARTSGKQDTPLEVRLLLLYQGLTDVIEKTRPDVMVIEKVFFAKNAVSALKLGQARGAAILTGMIQGLSIVEYSPSEVKLALVGQGHADKDQVARMVELLIGKQTFETSDASDGMALAICHAHTIRTGRTLVHAPASPAALAYAEALHSASGQRKKKGSSLAESLGLSAEKLVGRKRVTPDKMR
jgi:crossover junction endodeoxyribonuclease RuvC